MTAKEKRIAIVFRGIGDIGGTNNTIADHARYLSALGYPVDLLGEKVHKGGAHADDMGRGVRISRVPLLSRYKWRWFAARAQRTLDAGGYHFVAGHGHHYRQDVLSMHNCMHRAHDLLHGTALDPRGTLAEVHDRIFAEQGFRYCICNSRLMRDDLSVRYGVDAARMPVIYPGYRPDKFRREDRACYREAVRAELGCGERTLIGLVTSGDFAKRGLDILLAAYARLGPGQREATRVLVLGKQAGNKRFTRLARELGVADQLYFVGATDRPERYFHALDICVHPARFEEFGQTVQEAMACGIPVVSTRRVGAMECLPKSFYDALPDKPSAEALAAELSGLIESADRRRVLAETGHAAVVGNTRDANFEATLIVYRRAGLAATFAERTH